MVELNAASTSTSAAPENANSEGQNHLKSGPANPQEKQVQHFSSLKEPAASSILGSINALKQNFNSALSQVTSGEYSEIHFDYIEGYKHGFHQNPFGH